MNFTKNQEWIERALKVLPGGASTESKQPHRQYRPGPLVLVRGDGAIVEDVDGNRFVDTVGALGPNILGYNYPGFNDAIIQQVIRGASFSLPHFLEITVAELLCERVGMDMVRFVKSGHEATEMARRLACAVSDKDGVAYAKPGYHGVDTWYAIDQPRKGGIPNLLGQAGLTHSFPFNDLDKLESLLANEGGIHLGIGAVIIEQGVDNPAPGFYAGVRKLCDDYGALFILDDVVTCFRLHHWKKKPHTYACPDTNLDVTRSFFGHGWGAKDQFGIEPDLICLGKAIAGGYPLGAVLGRREIMERLNKDVFYSTTFGGDAIALAACRFVMNALDDGKVLADIWRRGGRWIDGFKELIRVHGLQKHMELAGLPPRSVIRFHTEPATLRSLFYQESLKFAVHFGIPVFISAGHTDDDIERMLKASNAALGVIAIALASGEPSRFITGEVATVIQIGRG